MQAPDERVRLRAIEAIAFIGTDATVEDLVEAFHHDPSFGVRIEGGGCGLAHCGMLTRAQRMQAIPGLIDMVEDKLLDPATLPYGYRALREITDETLPDDSRPMADLARPTASRRRKSFASCPRAASRPTITPRSRPGFDL